MINKKFNYKDQNIFYCKIYVSASFWRSFRKGYKDSKKLTLAKRYRNTGTPPIRIAAGTSPRYCWLSKREATIGDIDRGGCCDTLCSGAETTLKPG